ncbi:hypothetical protein HK105_209229 [Polyrhizophydium stewartii]|uniref:Uncharacterized protein n=1 Tax=Polyrhizophydium stewartii TaxID=2732419 RepID=A0ABR4MVL2_9FUNG
MRPTSTMSFASSSGVTSPDAPAISITASRRTSGSTNDTMNTDVGVGVPLVAGRLSVLELPMIPPTSPLEQSLFMPFVQDQQQQMERSAMSARSQSLGDLALRRQQQIQQQHQHQQKVYRAASQVSSHASSSQASLLLQSSPSGQITVKKDDEPIMTPSNLLPQDPAVVLASVDSDTPAGPNIASSNAAGPKTCAPSSEEQQAGASEPIRRRRCRTVTWRGSFYNESEQFASEIGHLVPAGAACEYQRTRTRTLTGTVEIPVLARLSNAPSVSASEAQTSSPARLMSKKALKRHKRRAMAGTASVLSQSVTHNLEHPDAMAAAAADAPSVPHASMAPPASARGNRRKNKNTYRWR